MSRGTQEMRNELDEGVQLLETLLDEIQVKAHLAGMDAKDAWRTLRADAEKVSREASAASKHALDDVIARIRAFSKSLETKPSGTH